jgi:hypothetical protein
MAPPMRLRSAVILLYLVVQIALPLRYYLGLRDRYDERFSWRMFSSTRMVRCQPKFRADDQAVALAGLFHQAWLGLAQRGRRDVVEAMAHTLCATPGVQRVTLSMQCVGSDGQVDHVASGGFNLCALGGL